MRATPPLLFHWLIRFTLRFTVSLAPVGHAPLFHFKFQPIAYTTRIDPIHLLEVTRVRPQRYATISIQSITTGTVDPGTDRSHYMPGHQALVGIHGRQPVKAMKCIRSNL